VWDALGLGLVLGLGNGLAPGPLLSLVVLASLRGGLAAGVRVSLVPLVSDLPIVVLSLTMVSALPAAVVPVLSVVGGVVVVWFGVQALREAFASSATPEPDVVGRSFRRGVLMNMLSPHPWLFWVGVGAPIMVDTWDDSAVGAGLFVVAFYALLVGSKLGIAALVAAGRDRLGARGGRVLGVGAGVLMVGTGLGMGLAAL
jgi:threonine/homoserine/homoserine lactone efflux protein